MVLRGCRASAHTLNPKDNQKVFPRLFVEHCTHQRFVRVRREWTTGRETHSLHECPLGSSFAIARPADDSQRRRASALLLFSLPEPSARRQPAQLSAQP